MIICQNKQGISEFLPKQKKVVCTYHGKADEALALEHLEKIVHFYQSKAPIVDVAIVDLRALYGSFIKLMGYFTNTFYPAITKTSLRAQIIVVNDDMIINHLVSKLVLVTDLFSIKTRVFFSMADAEEWVNEFLKN